MATRKGFGVFSIASPENSSVHSPGVDDTGRMIRQRQRHHKSRHGCIKCKSRKVKCDEGRPTCRRCSLRGEECIFEDSNAAGLIRLHQSSRNVFPNPTFDFSEAHSLVYQTGTRRDSPLNIRQVGTSREELKSLHLMYHFEHVTSDTLIFGRRFWRDQILPLALHYDYLMHAVLTISASHLNHILPQQAEYKRAMSIYLSRALPGFRCGIGTMTSLQDSDAVIACGFLLLYYAWYVPFFNTERDNTNRSIDSDGLLWFATGLSEVITTAYEIQSQDNVNNGIFRDYAIPEYVKMLSDIRERTASAAGCLSYDFEGNFLRHPASAGKLQDNVVPEGGCRGVRIEDRLDPIFYAVDSLSLGLDTTGLMPSFMTYSLTWPTKAPREFSSQINAGEPNALLVLLSFYASVWLTLSSEAWWAHCRCQTMCEVILSQLSCQKTNFWRENIMHIAEYFRFKQKANGTWEVGFPPAIPY